MALLLRSLCSSDWLSLLQWADLFTSAGFRCSSRSRIRLFMLNAAAVLFAAFHVRGIASDSGSDFPCCSGSRFLQALFQDCPLLGNCSWDFCLATANQKVARKGTLRTKAWNWKQLLGLMKTPAIESDQPRALLPQCFDNRKQCSARLLISQQTPRSLLFHQLRQMHDVVNTLFCIIYLSDSKVEVER